MNVKFHNHSWLFRLACRLLKYFFVALASFTVLCIVLATFGAAQVANLLVAVLSRWFFRSAMLVLVLLVAAIVGESLRW